MVHRIKAFGWILILIGIFTIIGCTKEAQYIGSVGPSDNPYFVQIDTFSVQFEVERLDSFQTSGSNTILAGFNTDPVFGTINSSSYFRLTIPSVTAGTIGSLPNQGYDSLVLILYPKNSYYGDTTSNISLKVERVLQEITNDQSVFFNNQKFISDPLALGSVTTRIRPNIKPDGSKDTIAIKLSDLLGQQIYSFYKNNAPEVTNNDNFQVFLKGLKIVCDSTVSNVMYGFNSDSTKMRFYYHEDHGTREGKYVDFKVAAAPYMFNSIYGNTNGTALQNLTPGKTLLSSDLGSYFYINPLMGIRSKGSLPTIKNLLNYGDYINISSSILSLKPKPNSYSQVTNYALPPSIYLFLMQDNLVNTTPIANMAGTGSQTGSLFINGSDMTKTQYTYDISSSYINYELTSNIFTTRKVIFWPATSPGTPDIPLYRIVGSDNKGGDIKYRSSLSLRTMVYDK